MTAVSDPFWAAAAEGRLRLQFSRATGKVVHYPREVSPYATDDDLVWADADAAGTVLGSTIVHRHSHPEFAEQVPFGLALVELAVGARVLARFDPADDLQPGDVIALGFVGEPPLPFVGRPA